MGYNVVNWDKIRFISNNITRQRQIDPRDIDKVNGAVTHFMRSPQEKLDAAIQKVRAQEFTTAGDFPAQMNQLIATLQASMGYDMNWQQIFDVTDMSSGVGSGWDLAQVGSSLVFTLTPIGQKALYYEMRGMKLTVPFEYFSGGLLWHQSLFTDQQYWQLERNAVEFRNRMYYDRALYHYAMIEAIPAAQNIAWQPPVPAGLNVADPIYQANRDAETINAACLSLLLNNANKGYSGVNPDGVGTTFVISCPVQLKTRMQKAVSLVLQSFQGSEKAVAWNVQILPTTLYAATNVYYVCIPKNSTQHGNKMPPTFYIKFDQDALSNASVCWYREGATIADTQLFQRCSII